MFPSSRLLAAAGGIVLSIAAPAAALASPASHGHGHHGPASGSNHGKGTGHGKGGAGHGKGHSNDKFTAVGSVAAVDVAAGTVTVNDKGGTKALHGTTVTISVPDNATVLVDDTAGTLSDVAVNDHVVVKGTDAAATYSASKVIASTPDA